mmetsp:Transcript_102749/g.306990  ORF Transcript_102749/g.306990 Transcript_102749/m.306990 type:complete len:228 (-) Transcript_102749:516-1199(-)
MFFDSHPPLQQAPIQDRRFSFPAHARVCPPGGAGESSLGLARCGTGRCLEVADAWCRRHFQPRGLHLCLLADSGLAGRRHGLAEPRPAPEQRARCGDGQCCEARAGHAFASGLWPHFAELHAPEDRQRHLDRGADRSGGRGGRDSGRPLGAFGGTAVRGRPGGPDSTLAERQDGARRGHASVLLGAGLRGRACSCSAVSRDQADGRGHLRGDGSDDAGGQHSPRRAG